MERAAENTNEGSLERRRPKRIVTEQGSVYTYLDDGRTQRFKTATGERSEPQDLIVFIPPWDKIKDQAPVVYPHIFKDIKTEEQYKELILRYGQDNKDKTIRVTDGEANIILDQKQVDESQSVFVAMIDKLDPKKTFSLPVSKEPKEGYATFDARYTVDKKGRPHNERHVGNKIVEIEY